MSALFGVLGIADGQADFVADIGQRLVFDAISKAFEFHNEDVSALTRVFVDGTTEKFQERWLAPGSGQLSRLGQDPHAPGPAIGRFGEWDCAYQLWVHGESFSASDRALAKMSLKEIDAHVDTIMRRDLDAHRLAVMIALMEDTNLNFPDIINGNIVIRRLANGAGDGVLYPAIIGAAADAVDLHYLDAAYNVAGIADATNPVVDTRDQIMEHPMFGGRNATGTDILYIHGADQTPWLAALTDYDPVQDFGKLYGAADTPYSKLMEDVPGRMHGRSNGCWLTEWHWMPNEYGLAVHLGYPPLRRRTDGFGLPDQLNLVQTDRDYPLVSAHWRDVFGYGCYNRLSACAIEINAGGGVYTPPAAYAE